MHSQEVVVCVTPDAGYKGQHSVFWQIPGGRANFFPGHCQIDFLDTITIFNS